MNDDFLKRLESAISEPDRTTRVYAVYLADLPVVLFKANSLTEARAIAKETWLVDELRAATIAGEPLASPKSRIWVVRASPSMAEAYRTGVEGKSEVNDIDLVYIAPVDQIPRP